MCDVCDICDPPCWLVTGKVSVSNIDLWLRSGGGSDELMSLSLSITTVYALTCGL